MTEKLSYTQVRPFFRAECEAAREFGVRACSCTQKTTDPKLVVAIPFAGLGNRRRRYVSVCYVLALYELKLLFFCTERIRIEAGRKNTDAKNRNLAYEISLLNFKSRYLFFLVNSIPKALSTRVSQELINIILLQHAHTQYAMLFIFIIIVMFFTTGYMHYRSSSPPNPEGEPNYQPVPLKNASVGIIMHQ